jgi:hypothetical protein
VEDGRTPDQQEACSLDSPFSLASTAGQWGEIEGDKLDAEQLLLAATAGQELRYLVTCADLEADGFIHGEFRRSTLLHM